MNAKKNDDEIDYFDNVVLRPYIKRQEGKKEIHDYGSGINLIPEDKHGCGIDEAWVPTYHKKNGTIVHGHCRKMNTPLTKDEIHIMYSPSEWKEVEENNRKWKSQNKKR